MQNDKNKILFLYLKVITVGILILCVDRIFDMLVDGTSLFIPLVIAIFLSILLNPMIKFLEKYRIPHILAVTITMLVAVVIIFSLYETISQSISSFLNGFSKYGQKIDSLARRTVDFLGISPDVLSGELKVLDDPQASKLMEGVSLSSLFYMVLNSLTKFITQLIMVFLFLIFILMGRGHMMDKIKVSFSESTSNKFLKIYNNITEQVQKYLGIKTLISLLTSLVVMGVLLLFGVDFVLVWGILTFLFNFIPNIGSFGATLLPVTFALIQFDNPFIALWLALCLFGVQFVFGNILEPKIMGESVDLSAVVILFALLFWGLIWGVPGMFLAVPMTAVIKIIFENIEGLKPVAILMSGRVKS
jgi:predicted PurR-regulated permease PerM